jgi:23S rRNA (guanosine2251-2'-O)-methyltransferase
MRKLKLDELNRATVEEFKQQDKLPVVVVLTMCAVCIISGLYSAHQMRLAATAVYLCGITAQPPHREIEKTALGATQSVTWEYFEDTLAAIEKLRADGYQIVAIEQAENSTMLNEFQPSTDEKYALIFGNEVNGVSEEAMQMIDACIEIPQFGTKHSFNIVVSAGIVLWDFYAKIASR